MLFGLWAEALPAPRPREAAEPVSRRRTRHVGAYRTRGRAEERHGWVSVDWVSSPCLMLLASKLVPSPPRCASPAFDCVCAAVASLPRDDSLLRLAVGRSPTGQWWPSLDSVTCGAHAQCPALPVPSSSSMTLPPSPPSFWPYSQEPCPNFPHTA